jgi:hypothetical protein
MSHRDGTTVCCGIFAEFFGCAHILPLPGAEVE